jgi:hypothetical protein
VSPALHHADELPGDFPFTEQHGKYGMAEELLQIGESEIRCDPEQALTVKTAIRA